MPTPLPEISRFYGIVITIRFADHAPPHFHATYQGATAAVDIQTLSTISGRIQPRAMGLIVEWASMHQDELLANWDRASAGKRVERIAPLG